MVHKCLILSRNLISRLKYTQNKKWKKTNNNTITKETGYMEYIQASSSIVGDHSVLTDPTLFHSELCLQTSQALFIDTRMMYNYIVCAGRPGFGND